jgi:hypothetical protein
MADIYGTSEADKAKAAASQFGVSSEQGLANLNEKINKAAADLYAGIQVGLTPQQLEDKRVELDGLKQEAELLTTNIGSQYAFVGEQAEQTAANLARQLAATQTEQAQIGAATLGRLANLPAGFRQSAAQRDAIRAGQGTEAALQAYLGGTPSVSAELLPRVQGLGESTGATLGLAGIAAGGSNLFQTALKGLEAKTKADLARDSLVLGASIENQYRQEARDREARQREQAQAQVFQLTQSVLAKQAQDANTLAQLEAAAAGADTRSGKQIAQAKLKEFKDQLAIQHNFKLQEIAASSQAAGISREETQAILRSTNYNVGSQTMLADTLKSRLFRLSELPTSTTGLGSKETGWVSDGVGGAVLYGSATGEKPQQTYVDVQALFDKLIEAGGALTGLADAKTRRSAFRQNYWNNPDVISQADKLLLRQVFGLSGDPDFYADLVYASRTTKPPTKTTTKTSTKPTQGATTTTKTPTIAEALNEFNKKQATKK